MFFDDVSHERKIAIVLDSNARSRSLYALCNRIYNDHNRSASTYWDEIKNEKGWMGNVPIYFFDIGAGDLKSIFIDSPKAREVIDRTTECCAGMFSIGKGFQHSTIITIEAFAYLNPEASALADYFLERLFENCLKESPNATYNLIATQWRNRDVNVTEFPGKLKKILEGRGGSPGGRYGSGGKKRCHQGFSPLWLG